MQPQALNKSQTLSKDQSKAKLPEDEGFEVLLDKTIEDMWKTYDKDGSGALNRNESRKMIK